MSGADGYAMAVILVGIAMMAIMLTVAMPAWNQMVQREKEEELIFRGTQYMRAIGLYQRKFAGGYPPNVDFLVQQKFLRKKYKDPMVPDGQFELVPAGAVGQAGQVAGAQRSGQQAGRGQSRSIGFAGFSSTGTSVGPFAGVVSKSTDKSIKLYNGRDHYNEWLFVFSAATGRGAGPGAGRGGGRGMGPGREGGRGMGPGRGGPGRGMGFPTGDEGEGRGRGFNPGGRGGGGRGGRGFGPGGF